MSELKIGDFVKWDGDSLKVLAPVTWYEGEKQRHCCDHDNEQSFPLWKLQSTTTGLLVVSVCESVLEKIEPVECDAELMASGLKLFQACVYSGDHAAPDQCEMVKLFAEYEQAKLARKTSG